MMSINIVLDVVLNNNFDVFLYLIIDVVHNIDLALVFDLVLDLLLYVDLDVDFNVDNNVDLEVFFNVVLNVDHGVP